jgi:2,3-dihydroxybenzoate decarboxylase
MLQKPKCPIIALEEHYADDELVATYTGLDVNPVPAIVTRLRDVGEERLKAMDADGIDVQVLSHTRLDPGFPRTWRSTSRAGSTTGCPADQGASHPLRGFAALPTSLPDAAADELDRCVTSLGFKGAMIHGLANGIWLDDKRMWPIFARAEKLDVPIYLHPSMPQQPVIDSYYKEYAARFPIFLRAAWGYTLETATQAVRLVLSGVFDAHPNLKIILGHLGEGVPFLNWRINNAFMRSEKDSVPFTDIFRKHFYVTTSGFFSDTALLCSVMELGVDRIMFSVDYPFEAQPPAPRWLANIPLCDEDKAKIASGNASGC